MKKEQFIKQLNKFIRKNIKKDCRACEEEMEKIELVTRKRIPFVVTFRPDYDSGEGWHIEVDEE